MSMREEVPYAIFLHLQKAYGALYRDRYRDIFEEYGMGPQACHILIEYWDRIWIE